MADNGGDEDVQGSEKRSKHKEMKHAHRDKRRKMMRSCMEKKGFFLQEALDSSSGLSDVELAELPVDTTGNIIDCHLCRVTRAITSRRLPCMHVFHAICIDRHLKQDCQQDSTPSCPVCKMSIRRAVDAARCDFN